MFYRFFPELLIYKALMNCGWVSGAETGRGHGLRPATVHGDVTAFTFLIIALAVGAVVTALLYPGVTRRVS